MTTKKEHSTPTSHKSMIEPHLWKLGVLNEDFRDHHFSGCIFVFKLRKLGLLHPKRTGCLRLRRRKHRHPDLYRRWHLHSVRMPRPGRRNKQRYAEFTGHNCNQRSRHLKRRDPSRRYKSAHRHKPTNGLFWARPHRLFRRQRLPS